MRNFMKFSANIFYFLDTRGKRGKLIFKNSRGCTFILAVGISLKLFPVPEKRQRRSSGIRIIKNC